MYDALEKGDRNQLGFLVPRPDGQRQKPIPKVQSFLGPPGEKGREQENPLQAV